MCKWLVTWCLCGHGELQPTFQPCQRKSQGQFCHVAFYYDQDTLLHPTTLQCRLCQLGNLDRLHETEGLGRLEGLESLQSLDFSRAQSLPSFTMPPNMQYQNAQGHADADNEIANAMWTPTSLLFDQDILDSNLKYNCLPNSYQPVTNYSGNLPGCSNTKAASPLPSNNDPFTRSQNPYVCVTQPAASWPPTNTMSSNIPKSSNIPTTRLPEQLYQDYSTLPCLRTPTTGYASPFLPFLDGDREMSPIDFALYTQGTAWSSENVKKPGEY